MVKSEYFAPDTLQEAISLYQENAGAILVAGGTDLLVNVAHGRSALGAIIDLKRIRDLDYIVEDGARVRIGAMTTITEVAENEIIRERYPFREDSGDETWDRGRFATRRLSEATCATPLLRRNWPPRCWQWGPT